MNVHCSHTELVDIDIIQPNPRNPNQHPEAQIKLLAKIMKHQGWRSPVVISNRSGFVVKGHGRLQAAALNKWTQAPVDRQDYATEADEYADMVADNKIAELAESNLTMIHQDVLELGPDFDLDLLGIPDFILETNKLEPQCDEDEVPEKVEAKTKLGDLYTLGNHRLLCGDSTDALLLEKLTEKQDIELLLTDPPYGMSVVKLDGQIGGDRVGKNAWKNSEKWGAKAKTGTYRPIIGDDKPFEPAYLLTIANDQIIFGANHFSEKLPTSPHWIVWYKDMPAGTDFSGAELAWTSIDKKAVKTYKYTWVGMTRQGDRKDELTKRVHPTQKPVGLFEAILNDYDPKSIIDLYGGSGSTLIACEKTNRKCFMMELDPHYCDVIVARWEKYTGKKAELTNG